MKKSPSDTIVALSTPEGQGLRAVVRLSGSQSFEIAGKFFSKPVSSTQSHSHQFGEIQLDGFSVPASLGIFRGPRSYTREDMAEFYLVSSPPLVQELLHHCLKFGARLAEPGEFTRRAFLNGRLDLTQVEGVLELIQSRDESERRAGLGLLEGGLSSRLFEIRDQIESVLALLEASLDFEEVETGHIPSEELAAQVQAAIEKLNEALSWEERRSPARAELTVFLYGEPNAGKSSLLNQLDPSARAIISPIAGTTRDCLVGRFVEDGMQFWLLDAAGEQQARDVVEEKAQQLASRFRQSANFVVAVIDGTEKIPESLLKERVHLIALNKSDLAAEQNVKSLKTTVPVVSISAKTGEGIAELRQALAKLVKTGQADRQASPTAISQRHQLALQQSARELQESKKILFHGNRLDAAAASLRQALAALDEISGESHNEAILDRIFSQFCLGK